MSLIGVYGVSSFFSFLSFKMACFYITASLLTVSLLTSQSYIKSIGTKQTQRICVVVLKLLDLLIPIICFVLKHVLLPWKPRASQNETRKLKLQLYLEVYFKAIACLHLRDQRPTVQLQHMHHFVIATGTKHYSADDVKLKHV